MSDKEFFRSYVEEKEVLSIADMIDAGKYDVDLNEPTPLEKKKELVDGVQIRFYEDLLLRDVKLSTINRAWELSADVNGDDEALNPLFLHKVLEYIGVLEDFYRERSNEV